MSQQSPTGKFGQLASVDIVVSIQPADIIVLATELEQMGFYVPGVEDIVEGRMRILQVTDIENGYEIEERMRVI